MTTMTTLTRKNVVQQIQAARASERMPEFKGADLRGADLMDADLTGAKLKWAKLDDTILPESYQHQASLAEQVINRFRT